MKKLTIIAALVLVGAFVFAADTATKAAAPAAAPAATTAAAPAATTAAAPAATTAAAPAAAPAATTAAATTLDGTIAKIIAASKAKKTPAEISVVGADGKALSIVVKSGTTITGADGKALTFAKLAAKDKVEVVYTLDGKVADASSIKIVK